MRCEICDLEKRPLLRAIQKYTNQYGLDFNMEVWACLDCLGLPEREQ